MPPSMASSAPVMKALRRRRRTAPPVPTSSEVPKRRSGVCSSSALENASMRRTRSVSAVSMKPGASAFTRMPNGAYSTARPRVSAEHGALGGAVGGERAHAAMAHDRGEVDQRGAARRLQQREGVAGDAHHAVEVHLAEAYPVGIRHVAEVGAHVDAGVVDDHVEAAVRCSIARNMRGDVLAARDVDGHGRGAEALGRRARPLPSGGLRR